MNQNIQLISELFDKLLPFVSKADILSAKVLAEISSTILKKRLELNLTQAEYAKKLGVSQSMVSKWESEDYNYTINTLATICEKLEWTFDVVITPEENEYQNCLSYFNEYLYNSNSKEKSKQYNSFNLIPQENYIPSAG